MSGDNPERKNYIEIERLEQLLSELRENRSTARETEAIREIGLEIAVAVREVGAMLVNVGWEQSYVSGRSDDACAVDEPATEKGTITAMNPDGFGFIASDRHAGEVWIRPRSLDGA